MDYRKTGTKKGAPQFSGTLLVCSFISMQESENSLYVTVPAIDKIFKQSGMLGARL